MIVDWSPYVFPLEVIDIDLMEYWDSDLPPVLNKYL